MLELHLDDNIEIATWLIHASTGDDVEVFAVELIEDVFDTATDGPLVADLPVASDVVDGEAFR